MTLKDVYDLFDLLEMYFSGHPGLSAKNIRSAWLSVLEPYSREDVKKAVVDYLRTNTNFPRPQEIAVLCPPLQTKNPEKAGSNTAPKILGPMDARAKEAQERFFSRWKKEQDRLRPLRHAGGLPATWSESQVAGMTSREWWNALEAAGLNTPDSVWHEEAVADGTA